MLSKSQKRIVIGAAVLIAVVLFVVPAINVGRFRLSVARGLSQALGREVTVQGISIQTFPQPGLLLRGVSVDDDPTISAEPMLHADEVLATLRFSSLWRGRLEIGTLKLKYPSLNLARSNDGRWNLESLLERARETPTAPTAKMRPETRARFPYIESDGGRINLKIGNEKKVFALSDADFAVWLAAEDEWHMRLEARPIRTDANLSDTGTLKVEGSWRRAPALHQTPIYLRLWWDYGQLGQVSHLIYGRDRGWRGALHVYATVNGEPEDLKMRLDARVDDFRRYDIFSADSVSLEVHCNSEYNFSTKEVANIGCLMPAGSGVVLAHGNYQFASEPRIELSATAENVPLQFLAVLARHAKRDLPNDMNVSGMLSASVAVQGDYCERVWAGSGQISEAQVRSSVLSAPLAIEPSHWTLAAPARESRCTTQVFVGGKPGRKAPKEARPTPTSLAWRLEPIAVKLRGSAPAVLAGWFSQEGYLVDVRGEADLARLVEVAKLAGLPSTASGVTGTAKGALEISGEWAGFVPAALTADAQLHEAEIKFGGVSSPLRIGTSHFVADGKSFSLNKAEARFAGLHSALQFSATWPQHCVAAPEPAICAPQFNVTADQLNLDEVNALLNPKAQQHPWYLSLANTFGGPPPGFPETFASGRISAGKVIVKTINGTHFAANVSITPKGFAISDMTADTLGGKFSGHLEGDWTGGTPAYHGSGNFQRVSMAAVAALVDDKWAIGTANLTMTGEATGWNAVDLFDSASGTGSFALRNGAFQHVSLGAGTGRDRQLQFKSFNGKLKLYQGTFQISDGELASGAGIFLVSGTSAGRRLDVKLTRDGTPGYSITGTLEHPVVAPLHRAATQAKLTQSRGR